MSRKARPGVCGRCGRAVVRPTPDEVAAHLARSFVDDMNFTVRGHHYENGRLKDVRCRDHEERPPGFE